MKDLRIEIFFLLSPPMKRNVIYRAYVMEIFHPWKRVEESLLLLWLSSFLYALGETMERLFLEEEASYSSEACSADEVEKERSFNRVWNENSQILGIRVIVGERIFHIIICNVFVRSIKDIRFLRILEFIPLYIELRKIAITLIESSLILKSNVNFLHEWIGVKKKFSIRELWREERGKNGDPNDCYSSNIWRNWTDWKKANKDANERSRASSLVGRKNFIEKYTSISFFRIRSNNRKNELKQIRMERNYNARGGLSFAAHSISKLSFIVEAK